MKNIASYVPTLICLAVCSCNSGIATNKQVPQPKADSAHLKSMAKQAADTPCHNMPIWGYRFVLKGNFKGEGKQQLFTEHYYSCRDHKETNKFYSCATDVWEIVDSSAKKENDSYFLCSDPGMDTLRIGGYIGPLFVKNEGDLDGDGNDEIAYVPSLPQQSSMNHYHIISFKNRKWVELYSFGIREWQLPPMPQGGRSYGMFGSDGMYATKGAAEDSVLNDNLLTFHDLLNKTGKGRIKIHTWNEEADEIVKTVDLRHVHGRPL